MGEEPTDALARVILYRPPQHHDWCQIVRSRALGDDPLCVARSQCPARRATQDQKGHTTSTTARASRRSIAQAHHDPEKPRPADVLAVFGITGDLAKVIDSSTRSIG